MKTHILPSLRLTVVLIILCSVLYPLLLTGIAKMAPGKGNGNAIIYNGKIVGYENIGQKFTEDKYFWGRPSAVSYNAAGSGGSNKGPDNPDYLVQVKTAIDTFLMRNPGTKRTEVTADLVTASGSGLDPDISVQGAMVQMARVAKSRGLDSKKVEALVQSHVEKPLMGCLGPEKINVLKLNIALDDLK